MADSGCIWGCRRFEVLYRDVVVPLLRRSDFERHNMKNFSADNFNEHSHLPNNKNKTNSLKESVDNKTCQVDVKESKPIESDPDNKQVTPKHSKNKVFSHSATIDDSVSFSSFEEFDIWKSASIQSLWSSLFDQAHHFVRVLGHCADPKGADKNQFTDCTSKEYKTNASFKMSDCRDENFDINQFKDFLETHYSHFLKVPLDGLADEERVMDTSSMYAPETLHGKNVFSNLNSPNAIAIRQDNLIFLIDSLSSKINLSQTECLHLIASTIQALNNDIPPALNLEHCCMRIEPGVQQQQQFMKSSSESSLTLSSLGVVVIEIACARFRREQLHHLLCLQELAVDIYPLDHAGVEDIKSIGIVSLSFFRKILPLGFFENAFAALKFLMLESTRQKAQFLNGEPDKYDNTLKSSEWLDRVWSRRLAEVLVRLLIILCARFHPRSSVVLNVMELLEGSAFEEQAIRKIRESNYFKTHERRSTSITSRDFDLASLQDKNNKNLNTNNEDLSSNLINYDDNAPNMTNILTLLFLDIVNPDVLKWEVSKMTVIEDFINVQDLGIGTLKLLIEGTFPKGLSNNSWLIKKAVDDDIEAIWMNSTMHGQLISFAVSVGYVKPSDLQKLQLGLSSAWNIFQVLKEQFLDSLGGTSPLSKIAIQTIHSLVSQVVLPLNIQWSGHIMAIEKMTRHASQKLKSSNGKNLGLSSPLCTTNLFKNSSCLEPVISLINRICYLLPTAIPSYAPILFGLIDSFPWIEFTSISSRELLSNNNESLMPYNNKRSHNVTESIAFGSELCEVNEDRKIIDEEIPCMTGMVCPVDVSRSLNYYQHENDGTLNGSTIVPKSRNSYLNNSNQSFISKPSIEVEIRDDDFHFLLPLFIEVVDLAATICAFGHRTTAVQIATKLTSQPSLLGFFIPHTADRLQSLFMLTDSGQLQRQLVSVFQKRRSEYLLRQRGKNDIPYSRSSSSLIATSFFDEEGDIEEGEATLQAMIDQIIASILSSTTAMFRFFVASLSPRLFLTRPSPPPLLSHTGINALMHTKLLNWSYHILETHSRSSLGMMELSSILNGLNLLYLKAFVLDGLAGSLETNDAAAARLLSAFVQILPTLNEDLVYLRNLATNGSIKETSLDNTDVSLSHSETNNLTDKIAASSTSVDDTKNAINYITSEGIYTEKNNNLRSILPNTYETSLPNFKFIQCMSKELLGRLSTSLMTYITSVLFRLGYRKRYNTLIFEDETSDDSINEISNSTKTGSIDTTFDIPPKNIMLHNQRCSAPFKLRSNMGTLPTLTYYVVYNILPLLETTRLNPVENFHNLSFDPLPKTSSLLPPGYYWRLAVVTLKFIRCILRGPLPLLNQSQIDFILRESFVDHPGIEEGVQSTTWLMRFFLTHNSDLLDAILRPAHIAWRHLINPWDLIESSANTAKLQTVETTIDILVILFQRDIVFLYWWRHLRRTSVLGNLNNTSQWQFVSETAPIHLNFLRSTVNNGVSQSSLSLGHFSFLLEIVSSERHANLRKLSIYLIIQLNKRDPVAISAFLNQSASRVEALQSALATMLRDIELENIEQIEFLDSLGLLKDSDFPNIDSPDVLLDSCFVIENLPGKSDNATMEARLRDSLSVWNASQGLELSRFNQEISSTNLPALITTTRDDFDFSDCKTEQSTLDKFLNMNTADPINTTDGKQTLGYIASLLMRYRGFSSVILSNRTELPIHSKLEKRILMAEKIAVMSSDTAAWNVAMNYFDDIPAVYLRWIAYSVPQSSMLLLPPLPYLVPDIGAKFILQNSDQELSRTDLFETACLTLSEGCYSSLGEVSKNDSVSDRNKKQNNKPLSLLAEIMYDGSHSTSRLTVLYFFVEGLKSAMRASAAYDEDDCETIPTVFQLLGFVRASDSGILNGSNSLNKTNNYTTFFPLPFITSPFVSPDDASDSKTNVVNHWINNSMILFDSLALIVENVNLWINEVPGCTDEDTESFNKRLELSSVPPDVFLVHDALTNPASYSNVLHELYQDGHVTLASLEIFCLLLSYGPTSDAMLYILFVRLPHRHAILYQLLTTRWETPPSILFSVRKLLCASWMQLISLEAHLCTSYMANTSEKAPDWLVTNYPDYILKARLTALQNQCVQMTEGLWALVQAPLSTSIRNDMSSQTTCFSQGIPPILSCVLVHLASSESFSVEQDTSVWKLLKKDAFRFCTSTLGYMNPSDTSSRDNNGNTKRHSFQEFATLMLHPYQVLLLYKFFLKNHENEAKLKPLNYCMDFNYRSLSVFTAQRLLARFAELFSVSLNLIVIDLHNSRVFCVDATMEKTFGALNSPQEIFTTCLSHCLDYLGSLSLKKKQSRYCLMSIIGSLFNVLLTLMTSSGFLENALDESSFFTLYSGDMYSEEKYAEESVCLDRALLKSLLQKIIHLCVSGKHDQQNFQATEFRSVSQQDSGYLDSDIQNNFGSLQTTKKELDQTLRLRLYVAMLQIFWLAKISFQRETPTSLLLGVDISPSTIDFFLKQLQKDLLFLETKPGALFEKKAPIVSRSSWKGVLRNNDINLFSKLFPGLSTYPAESCVPVLKIFIEYRAVQTISDVFSSTNSLLDSNSLTEAQNECIAGHMLLPSSQWTLNSTTLQAIQLWIYHVFENFNDFNRSHSDRVTPLGIRKSSESFLDNMFSECITRHSTLCASTSVMRLALSLLHVLIKKPALCEALLASSIPVNPPIYMVTQATVNNVPLASVCRTVILAAPFLPRLNAPFTLKDFGFPTFVALCQDSSRITKLHEILKETNVASSVILLSSYMFIIDNVLTKVKHLQVCLTVEMLDEDAQRTTTTVERASWYFFKWWLARDHQFSSCFSCYNQVVEDLKGVLKEDFLFKSDQISTMTSSTDFPASETSHSYFANESLSTFLRNTSATKQRIQSETLTLDEHLPTGTPQTDIYSQFVCTRLLQKRFKNLSLILVLTSHSWLQLLTTVSDALLMQSQIKNVSLSTNDRNTQESLMFRIPHDDVFLTLQFQSRTIQSAVLITQLSTFQNSLQMTCVKGPFHSDVSRVLVSPFHFKMSHLDVILPYIQQRQQFLVTTLQSVGMYPSQRFVMVSSTSDILKMHIFRISLYHFFLPASEREFLIVKLLLRQAPIEENKDQQIQEQIKRSLLERTRSLVALLNATMLGLLVSVPLDCKNFPKLIKDIDAFLYLPRSKHQEQLEEKSKSYNFFEKHSAPHEKQSSTVAFYVRILSLASGLLLKGLQMILDLEKIPIKLSNLPFKKVATASNRDRQNFYSPNHISNMLPLSSSNLTKAFKSALERITTTTDTTLGSPIQSQALHLCGRVCSTISKLEELSGFNIDDTIAFDRTKSHKPIPLKLLQGSCKIVCTHALTLSNLFMTIND